VRRLSLERRRVAVVRANRAGVLAHGVRRNRDEGYSNGSWSQLVGTSPLTAGYMIVLFRMYGIYCVLFGPMASVIAVTAFRRGEVWAWWPLLVGNTIALVSAMRYDWTVNAIGPFELTEYLGLAMIYGALPAFPIAGSRIGASTP